MSDLLITINSSSSKKYGFLILETYYTQKVDSNKSSKFKGGSISPANIFNGVPVENCNQYLIAELLKNWCWRLSVNAYYCSFSDFQEIIDVLCSNRLVFLDNPDKSLVVINHAVLTKSSKRRNIHIRLGILYQ